MSIESNDGLITENADYVFQTNHINIRYFLSDIINYLFFQYGILSTNWSTKSTISSNENSQIKATYKTNYPNIGINIGLGVNWVFDNSLSSGLNLIKIISEEPSYTYDIEEDWECSSSCRSDYESDVKKYTPKNSVYFNIGYNF